MTTSWNKLKLLFQLVFHPGKDGRHSLRALSWLERCEFIVRSTCTQDARKVFCTARLGQTGTTASTAASVFSLPLRTHRLLMTWHNPIRMRWEPWRETATDFGFRR